MSGVALTSPASSRVPTVRPDDELRQVLPAPPVGSRIFPVGDELALFAEIYDNAGGSPHKVDITTTVTADEGKVLFKIGRHARFVGAAGEERRLRLHHAGAAAGDAAGTVRAEGRGAVASGAGTDDQSPGAVPDRGGAGEPEGTCKVDSDASASQVDVAKSRGAESASRRFRRKAAQRAGGRAPASSRLRTLNCRTLTLSVSFLSLGRRFGRRPSWSPGPSGDRTSVTGWGFGTVPLAWLNWSMLRRHAGFDGVLISTV